MQRIKFLFLVPVAFAIGCASSPVATSIPEYPGLSILQGHTTENSTQLTVVVPADSRYGYVIQPENPFADPAKGTPKEILVSAERKMRNDSPWAVDKISVRKLNGTNFIFYVVDNKERSVIEKRYFSTLALDGKKEFKFAVASCLDDGYPSIQKEIWPQLMGQDPDAILMIGDNVYADKYLNYQGKAQPPEIWKRYVETRKRLDVFFWERLVPIYAVWDDHDFGENNGNQTYEFKKQSAEILATFFAQEPDGKAVVKGPGVSYTWDVFGQRFIFLDDRSFQDEKSKKPRQLLGEDQEKWAIDAAKKPADLVWLISGMQFFGGYHKFESFEGEFKSDFDGFLARLRKTKNKFLFLSGDRHLFEAMEIPAHLVGKKTYEFTTSGMHAKMYPAGWDATPNTRQIKGVAEKPNYVLVHMRRDGSHKVKTRLEAWSINEQIFEKELEL